MHFGENRIIQRLLSLIASCVMLFGETHSFTSTHLGAIAERITAQKSNVNTP